MLPTQIYINPRGTGLTHTLATTTFGLNFSDSLNKHNINNVIFFDCPNFRSFHEIFNVQHKNFSKQIIEPPIAGTKLSNSYEETEYLNFLEKTVIITADNIGKMDNEIFLKTYQLTPICLKMLQNSYTELDNGNYATIHVRGSCVIKNKHKGDYNCFMKRQTDRIENAIKEIPKYLKILLISDNQDVLLKYVDNKRVFTTSIAFKMYERGITLPPEIKLHGLDKNFYQNSFTNFDVDFSGVMDLFLMAHSKMIYPDQEYSGYAQTGKGLYNTLMSRPDLRLIL